MYELLQMILVLAAGIGIGYLVARAKTFSDYNYMYSHLTCEIVSRMTDAMRSLCVDQDMIDRVIKRMGCKIIPGPCPPPPTPPEKDTHAEESEDEMVRNVLLEWCKESHAVYGIKGISFSRIGEWLEKLGDQKSAVWSEEDEKVYRDIIESLCSDSLLTSDHREWFKNVKYRLKKLTEDNAGESPAQ